MSPAAAPNGAQTLTTTPDEFLAACRADMARARVEVARLKDLPAPRETLAALGAYDAAMSALGDAAARASVCRNAHPDEKMRDAAETCEQEIDGLATELSLDRGVYDALAALSLDGVDGA